MNRSLSFVIGAAAAFLVATAWNALQSAPVAPAVADKTLGMALMSATVDAATPPNLIRGSGVVSVNRQFAGFHEVVFNRDLSNCSCTASTGRYSVGNYTSTVTAAANCPYASNSVVVATTNHQASFTDSPFHLIVFCPN
jgi:hypothetical protein